jgi:hypothetical protein
MSGERISNVFVLSTGRCGTMTFVRACEHIENFSAGHESLARMVGPERFAYPDRHIEADNRLSWMLGGLGAAFDDSTTLYVHLTRDRDAVTASFEQRWDSTFRASIIRAFGHGIITRTADWDADEQRRVCEFYVDTVNANIAEFVRERRAINLRLETLADEFGDFLALIGAQGDRRAMLDELAIAHNAS